MFLFYVLVISAWLTLFALAAGARPGVRGYLWAALASYTCIILAFLTLVE